MKYMILSALFLIIIGCKENIDSKKQTAKAPTELQKKLIKIDLPIEVIQANVLFLSNLVRVDNAIQLRYELNILNNYRRPFTLNKVEVYDLNKEDVLVARFDSLYIDEHFDRPGTRDLNGLKLLSGNDFGILNLEVNFNEVASLPEKMYHKLYFDRENKEGETITHPMEVAIVKVPFLNDLTLRLPFNKKGKWLYETMEHQGARSLTEGSATYPQRFAIDWTYADDNGSLTKGDFKENENWLTYGIELVAVADGIVVGTKDGIIENEPLSEKMALRITGETIGGNYIMIDIGNGIYAFYGHLIPESLKVSFGDKVKKRTSNWFAGQ
jgi:hypothetical protein